MTISVMDLDRVSVDALFELTTLDFEVNSLTTGFNPGVAPIPIRRKIARSLTGYKVREGNP